MTKSATPGGSSGGFARPALRKAGDADVHPTTPPPSPEEPSLLRIGATQAFFAEDAVDALGFAGKQFQHGLEARQQRGLFSFIMHMRLRAVCIGRRAA